MGGMRCPVCRSVAIDKVGFRVGRWDGTDCGVDSNL